MYNNPYNSPNPYNYGGGQSTQALDNIVGRTMRSVYFRMTLALAVTACTALFCATSIAFLSFLAANSWFMLLMVVAEIGLVVGISGGINKLSSATASLLFYLFAIVNGLMLSTIFVVYSPTAIAKTFFITAGTFGAMSVYGFFTTKSLAKMGSLLFMALIGLIIASLVNIFLHSSSLDWIISIVGVLIFVGLTAWDTQQIKQMAMMSSADNIGRLATIGALTLYLDFINLFLYLLRIFGNRD